MIRREDSDKNRDNQKNMNRRHIKVCKKVIMTLSSSSISGIPFVTKREALLSRTGQELLIKRHFSSFLLTQKILEQKKGVNPRHEVRTS
jgi:hypothetical protein